MKELSIRDARRNFSQIINLARAGETIVITRRGRPVARMVGVETRRGDFQDRSEFRSRIQASRVPSVAVVRRIRDEY